MFDRDAFDERAAIAEYCGGLSRFAAETLAAKEQGMTRWEALNAIRFRDPAETQHQRPSRDGDAANNVSGVQSGPEEQDRPVPVRDVQA